MRRAWQAFAAYLGLAIIATWPLARGLGRDVAWDLGDSVFVMWALAWDGDHLLAILQGNLSAITTFFDANIFHPASLTLAYSEHFIAQAVQVLPVWAVTGNPILCYNLLLLSTFALSGLGAYLFVRELTGNPRAAFVAGLLFAFAPYRIPQSSHLQVLSSQWMPFALYGLRRYFASIEVAGGAQGGRWRPLAGAAMALVAQNLSCGYYLMFFFPFVAAYVFWEILQRGVWRRWTIWMQLGLAGVAVVALTAPFVLPYAAVRDQLEIGRGRGELLRYSADVYSYATAFSEQPLWGQVARAFPKPEGDLFPGLVAVLLALMGAVTWRSRDTVPAETRLRTLHKVLLAAAAVHVIVAIATLLYRRWTLDLGLFVLRIGNIDQLLLRAAVLVVIVLVLAPGARASVAAFMRARGFFVAALIAAMWLSLGPAPQALGRPLDLLGPYRLLSDYVPGFDGLRVPARFAMIAVLMLAILGGYGAAWLSRWRAGTPILIGVCVAFLAESLVLPFTVNGIEPLREFATPEARLYRPERAPSVYQALARERDVVLAELPLGQADYDVRAMFYSIVHHGRILNGYSGFFPPHYGQLALALSDVPAHPDAAWQALRAGGASHVIVHENAWLDEQGRNTAAALRELGATEIFRDGGDVLMALR
ncbi:MAG TPA: hypothetical protein VI485_10445 [Vicinamibacterales bacterium]|nr:hypothetical protein [Vicinamibacterales bacterium]